MNKIIAIITARGGSKRIPQKNIKLFLGKPLISYSISAALKSNIFERVLVSTDDERIANVAREYGAEVPFLRSKKNSDDYATTADVLVEVINELEARNDTYKYVCCIYPTAPFITPFKLKDSFEIFKKSKASSLIPVCQFSFPIQRSVKISEGVMIPAFPENMLKRSQDLETHYHDVGQFYWLNVEKFKNTQLMVNKDTRAYVISELEMQDIDNIDDWYLAEIKYKALFG